MMLLTKEAQYAWVQHYAKTHTHDETFSFIDGIDKVIEYFEKLEAENPKSKSCAKK